MSKEFQVLILIHNISLGISGPVTPSQPKQSNSQVVLVEKKWEGGTFMYYLELLNEKRDINL